MPYLIVATRLSRVYYTAPYSNASCLFRPTLPPLRPRAVVLPHRILARGLHCSPRPMEVRIARPCGDPMPLQTRPSLCSEPMCRLHSRLSARGHGAWPLTSTTFGSDRQRCTTPMRGWQGGTHSSVYGYSRFCSHSTRQASPRLIHNEGPPPSLIATAIACLQPTRMLSCM